MPQYYRIVETYTPERQDLERSRADAHFYSDAQDSWALLLDGLRCFDHVDLLDEDDPEYVKQELRPFKLIGDHGLQTVQIWANDGAYSWDIRLARTPEEMAGPYRPGTLEDCKQIMREKEVEQPPGGLFDDD